MRSRGMDMNMNTEYFCAELDRLQELWDKWADEHKINLAWTCSKWSKKETNA